MRDAVQEVRGAVEGVHNPARGPRLPRLLAGLLHQEAETRARMCQFRLECGVRLAVGLADEVRRPLAGDLQVLNLAEVAAQCDGRFAARLVHHRNQG